MDGTWEKILDAAVVKDDPIGAVEWIGRLIRPWSGHTSIRPVPGKGGCTPAVEALAVAGECLGRSPGGLSSKIHLALDGRGMPMSVVLTAGQAGDDPQLASLLDRIEVARPGGGRPRVRPEAVVADKAYSHPSTRVLLQGRGIRFTCPKRADQTASREAKGSRGGRPPAFDRVEYAGRNVVEPCINRLKRFRDLAPRYAKRAAYFRSELIIAAIVLWLQ